YYLPLKEAVFPDREKAPGVVAIDVVRGKVVARARSRKDRDGRAEAPGNLTFCDGQVVSQSATDLIAYPQMKTHLAQLDEVLKKDSPRAPQGLLLRGELRVEQGKVQDAVEDFRTALANNPDDDLRRKLRGRLYDALTELLRRDFKAGEKYLKEYEDLI